VVRLGEADCEAAGANLLTNTLTSETLCFHWKTQAGARSKGMGVWLTMPHTQCPWCEIERLNARLDKVESALQFIGNACDLHADETDVGVTFRECLVPTLQSEP
jgi:hypothetical protein